jgi:Domain of unknown function (DUF4187)/G-patch domain
MKLSRFQRQQQQNQQQQQQQQQPAASQPATAHVNDDYMSATFTVADEAAAAGKRTFKRPRSPSPPVQHSKKSIAALSVELRDQGLATPIASTNPGFQLLVKLGWKRGGLGKDGSGIAAPVAASLKQGRAGIGHESKAALKKAAAQAAAVQRAEAAREQELAARRQYRESQSGQFAARKLTGGLLKARRLVQELDITAEVGDRTPLWPPEPQPPPAAAAAESSVDTSSRGAAYDSDASVNGAVEIVTSSEQDRELGAEWLALTEQEQLLCCLQYLRETHLYCMYCGHGYENSSELAGSCPGVTADDHDAEEL